MIRLQQNNRIYNHISYNFGSTSTYIGAMVKLYPQVYWGCLLSTSVFGLGDF